eukprot:CAMPEP_0183301814 /NCGR_PEP_ID=MMETSP0160_2-20130417/7815_1 /TAXON_ID=2839 ORGANISM="Odontella Sinensis, Strain Grunow 1884" /NCGR_SAMPLE_ID=MMETSP0160_2 /ASSEMBLY_ACC=CAM_ASM_000250 /LENGTH=632 /DNA_ID=CAMNT_0025464501 /DNA_START=39 /DNA_END=1937 /DNA_ORIENTATION=-
MGNGQSAAKKRRDTELARLQYLGDRYPFGDEEILRLARCYSYLRRARHARKSFLSDWAAFCATLYPLPNDAEDRLGLRVRSEGSTVGHKMDGDGSSQSCHEDDDESLAATRRHRVDLLEVAEGRILPSGFGRRLERSTFLFSQDLSNYSDSAVTESPGTPDEHDAEEFAFKRLEKFLEGASDCSRRGARPALTVLFKCCVRNSKGGYTADDEKHCSGAAMDTSGAYGQVRNENMSASAVEVLDMAYGLSLAACFLAKAAELESLKELDPADFIPEDVGTSLGQSLLAFSAKKKGNRIGAECFSNTVGLASGSTNSANVHGECELVSLDVFLEWAENTAPCLSACLSTFMHHILFPDRPYPPSRTPFLFPDLKGQSSAFFHRPASSLLFSLASMSLSLGGSWFRLYTSESDGLSFNRLQLSLLGYGGPTLIIIRATNGGIFGAFTSSPWKESSNFYGSSDCFLYQLAPSARVYRPRGAGTNYMYCNSAARSKGYDGLAHGIGFGGDSAGPRLFISETFDACVASSADLTFEPGPLLPPAEEGGPQKDFEISDIEVWGVGGEDVVSEGLGAQEQHRGLVEANIRKARKVDKAAFLDDFRSGLIESKAFKHREEIRGRDDCHIDEDDLNNYVMDK